MSEPNLVPPKNWIDNLPNLLHLSRCSQRPTPSRYQRRLMAVQRQSWGGVHTITSLGILVEFIMIEMAYALIHCDEVSIEAIYHGTA